MKKDEILREIADLFEDACPTKGCQACSYYHTINPEKLAEFLAKNLAD